MQGQDGLTLVLVTKKQRHALTNYVTVRRELKKLMDACDKKLKRKKGGRLNAKPLRERLYAIRRMSKDGSYES